MKYYKVIDYIKGLIDENLLKEGERLPSIRRLSKELQCSKSTVIKGYEKLEKTHYIYSIPKSGFYVIGKKYNNEHMNKIYDFLSSSPDTSLIPYREFQHCLNASIDMYKKEIFSYNSVEGLMGLRKEIVKYFQNFQIFTSTDNLIITTGIQQAINILLHMIGKDEKILIESPTYHGLISAITTYNIEPLSIDITNGLDFMKVEKILYEENVKFLFLTTRFQNPTGYSYSQLEKQKIIELIEKYDAYLVEDDYLGDLEENSKIDPFYSYDYHNRVIYLKSFSKVFLPGLRIGCVILPKRFKTQFQFFKFSSDINSPAISQGALELYLKNGMFYHHLAKLKNLYKNKLEFLINCCAKYLNKEIIYTQPKNGIFITLFLPNYLNSTYITKVLEKNNILVKDCKSMFLNSSMNGNAIRLCSSYMDYIDIENGLFQLSNILNKYLKN